MGLISNFKAKRADKRAQEEYIYAHSEWETDLAIYDKAITAFKAAANGEDTVPNHVVQKRGEKALWTAPAIFHEVGKTPSRYVGGSSGISIPITKGIRYRTSTTRGTIIPGTEYQMDKDQGIVVLTTTRVIFTGGLKTQEWLIENILGANRNEIETDFTINVSNRQKPSGVRFNEADGKEFGRFLALAMSAVESGLPDMIRQLEEFKSKLAKDEPKLELPSAISAQEM